MKLSQAVFLIVIASLITIVFGYGHYLANDSVIKWTMVTMWAVFIGGLCFATMERINTTRQLSED